MTRVWITGGGGVNYNRGPFERSALIYDVSPAGTLHAVFISLARCLVERGSWFVVGMTVVLSPRRRFDYSGGPSEGSALHYNSSSSGTQDAVFISHVWYQLA